MRRRMMMQMQEDAGMSEWVTLEDTTLETTQKWNKTYDNSYNRYLGTITIPIGTSIETPGNTMILGSWCLYYRPVSANASYPQQLFVDVERIDNDTLLMKDAFMSPMAGTGYSPNERIRILISKSWTPKIVTAVELPAGTQIQVYAK